ncbi:MAG: nucleoside 2-deoxyribosyltransferase [bacterium]|nr:nucleoside 2-deoxyribosyltransferase [bacterium]
MKIYIAYRFSGADPKEVEENLSKIFAALKGADHQYFCTFEKQDYYKQQNIGSKEAFRHSLEAIDNCDTTLAFIDSEEKSEGMLLELGYALAKNKNIILAIKEGIHTLDKLEANRIIFKDVDDLTNQLQSLQNAT